MDFDLKKREFRDAFRLRYAWAIPDNRSVCVCCAHSIVDHARVTEVEREQLLASPHLFLAPRVEWAKNVSDTNAD